MQLPEPSIAAPGTPLAERLPGLTPADLESGKLKGPEQSPNQAGGCVTSLESGREKTKESPIPEPCCLSASELNVWQSPEADQGGSESEPPPNIT